MKEFDPEEIVQNFVLPVKLTKKERKEAAEQLAKARTKFRSTPQPKFHSLLQLYEHLPDHERIITDVLRQLIIHHLPKDHKEKLAFNVPCFYCKKRICIIWPASVKGGGVKEGVLLGFSQGYKLKDRYNYLERGTNKRIYYKIILSPDDIDEVAIADLLKEALKIDR